MNKSRVQKSNFIFIAKSRGCFLFRLFPDFVDYSIFFVFKTAFSRTFIETAFSFIAHPIIGFNFSFSNTFFKFHKTAVGS
ncbi:MAG: hypothetical protein BGO42_07990 [Flavobacterium sp. 40-81]|nr:MAG: hypothetical protein BGO42_07990 [Flavobacterium sp. 40-81]